MKTKSFIAPAGTPISISILLKWIWGFFNTEQVLENFKQKICNEFDVKYCHFVSTGRAALVLILKALAKIDTFKRNEIIIPSYTCYSVPSSIAKAGLKIRIIDIDPITLDYNYDDLEKTYFNNVLGILSANLYGLPNNLKKLTNIAEEKGIYLIDDAAQAMGSKIDGKYTGTYGIAGIYSMDKGKNITSMDGGIIVTNSEKLNSILSKEILKLPNTTFGQMGAYIMKIILYVIFLRPYLYWIPNSLKFLNLGKTIYTTNYPIVAYCPILGAIGLALFKNLTEISKVRIRNAKLIKEKLIDSKHIDCLQNLGTSEPVYLRFPVLTKNINERDALLEKLNDNGIGASGSYPDSVFDLPEIKDILNIDLSNAKNGQSVSKRIITLPTHSFVKTTDIDKIAAILE